MICISELSSSLRRATFHILIIGALLEFAQLTANATGNSVTLAWQPSTDTNVVGYNVYYGNASGDYTNEISNGDSTNAEISGLVAGATYYFSATAYDGSGDESPYSNETSYSVPATMSTNSVPANNPSLPPTLNVPDNLVINENAGLQTVNLNGITAGTANGINPLTVTAASSNPALIPQPTVNYTSGNTTGILLFTPTSSAIGTATITVTVNNGQAQNNFATCSFTVTVNATNSPPKLNPVSKIYLVENGAAQTLSLTGISSPIANINAVKAGKKNNVKITAVSGNRKLLETPTIRYSSQEAAGTMTIKPKRNAVGTTTITVTVKSGDNPGILLQQTFTVTILAKGSIAPGNPPIPATLTVQPHAEGQFAVAVAGSTDHQYIVQATTNMVDWIPVLTNTPPFTYTETNAGQFSQRFYRSIPAP